MQLKFLAIRINFYNKIYLHILVNVKGLIVTSEEIFRNDATSSLAIMVEQRSLCVLVWQYIQPRLGYCLVSFRS